MYLHNDPEFEALINIVSEEQGIIPELVEKDYWIMHCLSELNENFEIYMKGGTSLSKGFQIIDRFSEDIDVLIEPHPRFDLDSVNKRNNDKYVKERKYFFDELAKEIEIDNIVVGRDESYDDEKVKNAGIKLDYKEKFKGNGSLKNGILLEVGFSRVNPFEEIDISSWAYDKAIAQGVAIENNQAEKVKCYSPGYTFIEKVRAIITKHNLYEKSGEMPPNNFLRHYFDVYFLIKSGKLDGFFGTSEFNKFKSECLGGREPKTESAFNLDAKTIEFYTGEYNKKRSIYYGDNVPTFKGIIDLITLNIDKL